MTAIRALLAALALTPFAISAEECGDATTQIEMNDCAYREYKRIDKELNTRYNNYRKLLDNDQRVQLREVQRAWIKFRDLGNVWKNTLFPIKTGISPGKIKRHMQ